MHVVYFLAVGLIVGAIARLLVPGREPSGWIVSIVIGVFGSLVGGFIGRALGFDGEAQRAGWLLSLFGAVVLLLAYHAVVGWRASS